MALSWPISQVVVELKISARACSEVVVEAEVGQGDLFVPTAIQVHYPPHYTP